MADILWSAAVQDQTQKFFDSFDHRVDQMQNRTNSAMDATQVGSRKSAAAIGLIGGAVGGVASALVNMAMQAASSFKRVIASSIQVAARAETLAISLQRVGENAGYTTEELAKYEEQIKGAGITTAQTRQIMVQMIGANLDLADAYDLARAAQNLAVVAGTNSSVMLGRLTHAILTLNPAMLTDIGLNVNLQQAYKATGKELDYAAKKQIAVTEVLRAAQPMMGTYEAAMESAGKQAGSMARHVEELQLAIGQAFQPAYSAWIQFLTGLLKEAKTWFEENAGAVEDFGERLGIAVEIALNAINKLIDALQRVPGLILGAGKALAVFVSDLQEAEAEERMGVIGTAAAQAASLLVTAFVTGFKVVTETALIAFDTMIAGFKLMGRAFTAPPWQWGAIWEEGKAELADTAERFRNFPDVVRETAAETMMAMGELTGLFKLPADEAEKSADRVKDAMSEIVAETESALSKIKELNEKFAKEMAEIAKKRAREEIDIQIRESRRWEDFYRNREKRIQKFYKDAAKQRARLLKDAEKALRDLAEDEAQRREDIEIDHNRDLLDIEKDYQRRLEDIRSDFLYNLQELARKNDAVGILRLMRETNRRLKEEEKGRDRSREDAKEDRDRNLDDLRRDMKRRREELKRDMRERMKEFEEDLAEREREFEESLREQEEELRRSLAQEAADRARHRKWEEEDRAEKWAKEFKELGTHLGSLESLDEASLKYLLGLHGQYIQDDLAMWTKYYEIRAQMAADAARRQRQQWGWGPASEEEEYFRRESGGYSDEWYQRGGFGVATQPRTIHVGEAGPEAFAVLPVSQTVRHTFSDLNINLQGVSPAAEAELLPVIYEAFTQLAQMASGA